MANDYYHAYSLKPPYPSVKIIHIEMFDFYTCMRYAICMTNQYIKSLRIKRGFSQLEIAEKIGISRSSYIAFEQGTRELTLTEADELSKIFEISLEDIQVGKSFVPKVGGNNFAVDLVAQINQLNCGKYLHDVIV